MSQPASPPKDPLNEPETWNVIAEGYDEEFLTKVPAFVENALSILGAPSESTVLDLGTGPGTFAKRAASRFAKVVAVDFAEQMIERLASHVEREGIRNVETHVMDGHALSLPDASFDAVVSMFGWFTFSDRARALAEIHRVLRPGGRVLVTSWAPPDRNAVLGMKVEALRHALRELPRPPGPLPTQIPETCAAEVQAAGFRDVRTDLVRATAEYDSVDTYWRAMDRSDAPMLVLRKKHGDDRFEEVLRKGRDYLIEKLGSGRVALTAEAIYTSATR
ncbi:MAG: class I SAM-dependent methyltransferase [Acidobacteriota bacterium]